MYVQAQVNGELCWVDRIYVAAKENFFGECVRALCRAAA